VGFGASQVFPQPGVPLGFLQSGREIGSWSSGTRFPRIRQPVPPPCGAGSPTRRNVDQKCLGTSVVRSESATKMPWRLSCQIKKCSKMPWRLSCHMTKCNTKRPWYLSCKIKKFKNKNRLGASVVI
jgi:hypothetical protein